MTKVGVENDRSELSPGAINKNVLKTTIEHPTVLVPAAVGGLGLAALVLLEPSLLYMIVAASGALVGALSWGANFSLRKDYFSRKYIEQVAAKIEAQRIARSMQLQKLLAETSSEQGLGQFTRSEEKFAAFKQILDKKLNSGELTHSRYMAIAEQVYLSILDNLTDASNILHSIKVIDEDYIQQRLTGYKADAADEHTRREYEALNKRLALHNSQQQKVRDLFTQNEEAMTQLDMTIASIAAMRTDQQQATMDMESAMAELARLASRSKDY